MGTKGNNQHQGDAGGALVRPAAAIFVIRPILVCLHPKAGMAFLTPEKPPFGAGGGGKVFLHRGTPKSALYRIWFNAYLTT
jgi:hypothetical protein